MQAHLVESRQDVLTLHTKVALQCNTVLLDSILVEHLQSEHLHRMRGATVEVRTSLIERGNEILRSCDPADTPAGAAPILCQAIDEDHRRVVDVFDIFGGGDRAALVAFMKVPLMLDVRIYR